MASRPHGGPHDGWRSPPYRLSSPCHGYERAAPLTSSYFVTRAGNGTWHAELNIGADANWTGGSDHVATGR